MSLYISLKVFYFFFLSVLLDDRFRQRVKSTDIGCPQSKERTSTTTKVSIPVPRPVGEDPFGQLQCGSVVALLMSGDLPDLPG